MNLLNDSKRFHIFQKATELFLEKGFDHSSMEDVALAAGYPSFEVYKFFGNKEDIIFHLYRIINNDWEAEVSSLKAQKLSARFQEAIRIKLELIAPYKGLLKNLLPVLLDDDALGVFSLENRVTRAQGAAIIDNIVSGSDDFGGKGKKKKDLSRMLYLFHWSVLFLSLHERNNSKSLKLLDAFAAWFAGMNAGRQMLLPFLLPKISDVSDILFDEKESDSSQAKAVLETIFNKRKLIPGSSCQKKYCDQCFSLHLPKVQYYIDRGEPISIILPAFPAKSPNLDKVLGALPDLGEEIALLSLQNLCEEISRVYRPGAHITICADGRIFADLVQVSDASVTAYTDELRRMIAKLNISNIDVVNLEDLITEKNFDTARAALIQQYAEAEESLREKIRQSEQHKSMFNGMHRFISEDRLFTEPGKSKSKIKEEAKDIAIGVILRSNAWTRFLGHYYPNALRLSIHPQLPHSEKIGIRLTRSSDEWITPWHGVIVLKKDHYTLMKKHEAEAMNALLIYQDGRPNHYSLNPET